jgi:SAM-dependent methyltransferase
MIPTLAKLNLGCGNRLMKGYLNLDNNDNCQPDVRHDLNSYPYPFVDGQFDEVYCDHVIEHLDDALDFLQECHRITRDGGMVIVKCPHFSCNWIHPRHKTAISSKLFDFLDDERSENYGQAKFQLEKVEMKWLRRTEAGHRSRPVMKLLNRFFSFLANRNIAVAERIWCYWVGGFEEISFLAKVIKR